jgi:hypothetical protein
LLASLAATSFLLASPHYQHSALAFSLSFSVFAFWFIIGVDRGEMCNAGSVGEQAGDRLPPLVFIP